MTSSGQSVTVYWITTDMLERGGEKVSGPYLTQIQALGARETFERRRAASYWVRPEELTVDELVKLATEIDG
jgi:hypothetical protein